MRTHFDALMAFGNSRIVDTLAFLSGVTPTPLPTPPPILQTISETTTYFTSYPLSLLPSNFPLVVLLVTLFHILTFTLYALLPARSIRGYVLRADGTYSSTRLAGFVTLLVSGVLAASVVHYGGVRASLLWESFSLVLVASLIFGLVISSAFYIRGLRLMEQRAIDERPRCSTVDQGITPPLLHASDSESEEFRSRSALTHFYAGLSEYNPEWMNVDIKMWLYATGAILLGLHIASAVAADSVAHGGVPKVAVTTSASLLGFFIIEYMWQEDVHCEEEEE